MIGTRIHKWVSIANRTRRLAWSIVLLTGVSGALGGCATVAQPAPEPFEKLTEARLTDLRASFVDIKGDQGSGAAKSRAVIQYYIGELSADYNLMGNVVDQFEALRQQFPKDAELTAYLGSAYTLRARDYPWKGIFQLIPGPGFVRLWDTHKGVKLLNTAVKQDVRDPVVRLIRGITFTHLPDIFGQYSTGLSDLNLVRKWIEQPPADDSFTGMLKDPAFRGEVYFRLAEVYWLNDNKQLAKQTFSLAAKAAPFRSPLAIAAEAMSQ